MDTSLKLQLWLQFQSQLPSLDTEIFADQLDMGARLTLTSTRML
jgi:hypothetical protein